MTIQRILAILIAASSLLAASPAASADHSSDHDGDGWSSDSDCNDYDGSIYPGAYDYPNDGVDQDCDGSDPYDPCYPSGCEYDNDGDGWTSSWDCNDWDSSVNPGAYDTPNDGIDQDCNGSDTYDPCYPYGCYVDNDGDGWEQNYDCNDWDSSINPGSYDYPNDGIDQDCSGSDAVDSDGDGYYSDSDCDDSSALTYPGAWDTPYDGIDQDCTGMDTVLPSGLRATFTTYNYHYGYSWGHDEATIGIEGSATPGFDVAYDTPEPPMAPTSDYTLSASLVNSSQPAPGDRLSTSVVPGATTVEWKLHIEANNPSCYGYYYYCTQQLQWSFPLSQLPREFNAYVVDGTTMYDMRSYSGFSYYQCCYTSSKDLRIIITSDVVYSHYLPSGWSLMSAPVQTPDMSISTLFGGYVNTAYTYDGSSYQTVTALEPGKGYWVYNPNGGVTISMFGTPVRTRDVQLHTGWNIVGAPRFGGPLNAGPNVATTGFYWATNGYYQTQYLYEGYGTWVYATEPTTLHLATSLATPGLAPVPGALGEARVALPALAPEAVTPPTFSLPFAVADASGAQDAATLEMRAEASSGFDAKLDVMEAPRPAVPTWTRAFFLADGHEMDRASVPTASRESYALHVARSGPAGEVTLSWDPSSLPEGSVFELIDGEERIDMRAVSTHSWTAPAGASQHELGVIVRPAGESVCLVSIEDGCLAALPFDPLAQRL